MKIQIIEENVRDYDAEAIVILTSGKGELAISSDLHSQIKKLSQSSAHQRKFKGEAGDLLVYRSFGEAASPHIIFVGVADKQHLRAETMRNVGAQVFTILKSEKISTALFYISERKANDIQCIVEGFLLASYKLDSFKSQKSKDHFDVHGIAFHSMSTTDAEEVRRGEILANSTNFARKLGDFPPSYLTPRTFCDLVTKEVSELSIQTEVWDSNRLTDEKMMGLITVGRGSNEESRMLVLRYNGSQRERKPICLVGKGLTFDSGGLDIKSTKNMEEMRYDMCGAAAVVAATMAIARLRLPVNIIVYAALAENMPGPGAVKPGDIYTARNGKTVEVMNTDAEGRLVLADALCVAQEEQPLAIIDVATLTGAVIAALGNIHTGLFTRSNRMLNQIMKASEQAGEKIWQLPLSLEHEEDIKGHFADIANQGSKPGAGSATAAAFLSSFVSPDTLWAHLDIAGTAQNIGERVPYASKHGASGVMVRTLIRFVENFE